MFTSTKSIKWHYTKSKDFCVILAYQTSCGKNLGTSVCIFCTLCLVPLRCPVNNPIPAIQAVGFILRGFCLSCFPKNWKPSDLGDFDPTQTFIVSALCCAVLGALVLGMLPGLFPWKSVPGNIHLVGSIVLFIWVGVWFYFLGFYWFIFLGLTVLPLFWA